MKVYSKILLFILILLTFETFFIFSNSNLGSMLLFVRFLTMLILFALFGFIYAIKNKKIIIVIPLSIHLLTLVINNKFNFEIITLKITTIINFLLLIYCYYLLKNKENKKEINSETV